MAKKHIGILSQTDESLVAKFYEIVKLQYPISSTNPSNFVIEFDQIAQFILAQFNFTLSFDDTTKRSAELSGYISLESVCHPTVWNECLSSLG